MLDRGEGGGAARAARAVTMSTNLCELWLSFSPEIHVIDCKVRPIVAAAFLKFRGKGVFPEKEVFREVS